MKLKLPTASRKRLEKLLEYLGNTGNYSKYYKGNRAEDFKKCFDIDSPWCWKYADIVLRGLKKRELGYAEGHHVVPRAFYGAKYGSRKVDSGNWFVLSYGEHLWAHYCAARCGVGKMQGKMSQAFITMYSIGIAKKRPMFPSDKELLSAIPELEVKRIASMTPGWMKVEAEGRTHKHEDPRKAKRDWYATLPVERKRAYVNNETRRKHRAENIDRFRENARTYYHEHIDDERRWSRESYKRNREQILAKKKVEYHDNPEKFKERNKNNYANNKDSRVSYAREYRAKRIAEGYRVRIDPATGKRGWVFVGLPATPETPKSSTTAA